MTSDQLQRAFNGEPLWLLGWDNGCIQMFSLDTVPVG